MYKQEQLFQMITSKKASTRYEACEWLRISQVTSPEIVIALEKATHDEDNEVAERARLALHADIHHQIAVELGFAKPATSSSEVTPAPQPEQKKPYPEASPPESFLPQEHLDEVIMKGQLVTFFSVPFVLILLFFRQNIYQYGVSACFLVVPFLAYLVLQIIAIRRYGFMHSFDFLKLFLPR